jgi:signal transduction histidine kinase
MAQQFASTTLTLPNLIGLPVADSPCTLRAEQFIQLGSLLLAQRPQDGRAICFLGGVLGSLAKRRDADSAVVALEGDLGSDPFLVIAGPQGALALLAVEELSGYRVRLYTDLDKIDRIALVLSQFADHSYSLDAMGDNETQRGFVASVVAALLHESGLSSIELSGLLPGEGQWLEVGRALGGLPGAGEVFTLAAVRRLLRDTNVQRCLVCQFDAEQQQLLPIASEGGGLPAPFYAQQPLISNAIHSQRPVSVTPADSARLEGELGLWVGGQAVTVVPLLQRGRPWGALLALSERPLPAVARATLNGLGALCAAVLGNSPAPLTVQPVNQRAPLPPAPAAGPLRAPMLPPPAPRTLATAVRPGQASATLAPPPPAPLALGNGPGNGKSAALPLPSVRQARSIAGDDLLALVSSLNDAVLLADSYGRIVSATKTAMELLGLQAEARGRSLVESGAWCLAPLLTDAVVGDIHASQQIELPNGVAADARVVELAGGMWAFVIHPTQTEPVPSPALAAPLPVIDEQERNESFLSNFSNIIRVPLRELRSLITQVPAAGNLNEQQSQLIGQVVRLNSELTMLVNDLLALGQIRLQSNEHRVALRLDLLLEAAVGTQYAEFGRRGQHVHTEIQPGLPRVYGSEEGLGRAVAALLDNAIKYSPPGAQITVSAWQEGREVIVAIRDTGPGLSNEELAQVFDPFYRAAEAERLGVSGRGLGLTITKAVIEQHGGRVWASGSPGKGCTFAFALRVE